MSRMKLADAVEHLALVIAGTAFDTGLHFTCGEADVIAQTMLAGGHDDEAVTWLEGHAYGDDDAEDCHIVTAPDGESHREMTRAELRVYIEEVLS